MSDVKDIAAGLDAVQRSLGDLGAEILREAAPIIGGRAVGKYMRDAKGEGRRRPTDHGPLRIVTGRLARSLTGARGRTASTGGAPEGIMVIETVAGGLVRLIYGSTVPYAGVHEHGSRGRARGITAEEIRSAPMRIARRAYLNPALQDSLPQLQKMAEEKLLAFVKAALSGDSMPVGSISLTAGRSAGPGRVRA